MAEPVSPVMPGYESKELEIAKDQPEYLTLPGLYVGRGVLLMRWRFTEGELDGLRAGQPVRLWIWHFAKGARPYVFAARRPQSLVAPTDFRAEPMRETADKDIGIIEWSPSPAARAEIVAAGCVWLYQFTGGLRVQPMNMTVGEVLAV